MGGETYGKASRAGGRHMDWHSQSRCHRQNQQRRDFKSWRKACGLQGRCHRLPQQRRDFMLSIDAGSLLLLLCPLKLRKGDWKWISYWASQQEAIRRKEMLMKWMQLLILKTEIDRQMLWNICLKGFIPFFYQRLKLH